MVSWERPEVRRALRTRLLMRSSDARLSRSRSSSSVSGAVVNVANLYHVVGYVVKRRYWRIVRTTVRLRSVSARPPSWHATGLVEKAWERLTPPRRDELARRMDVEGSDLSARNTSTDDKPRRLTLDYAERIVAAVRQDDPTFSVADLGAPTSVAAAADPTVVGRLEELAGDLAKSARRQAAMARELRQLRARIQQLEARAWPDEGRATGQGGR